MNTPELWKRWKVTEAHLRSAQRALPDPPAEVAAEFEQLRSEFSSFLDHNELELALDMLQELGELVTCRGGFWRDLERAAESMSLSNRIPYFRTRFEQSTPEQP